jgi:hypothetical protein
VPVGVHDLKEITSPTTQDLEHVVRLPLRQPQDLTLLERRIDEDARDRRARDTP